MSIRIGICSDSLKIRRYINTTFGAVCCCKGESYIFDYFCSIDVLQGINVNLDILFADMDASGEGSISILSRFMKENPIVSLIIITNCDDLVYKIIKLRPYRVVRKRFFYSELKESVNSVLKSLAEETILYASVANNTYERVRLVDVHYIESKGHYLNFHTDEADFMIRGKISEYSEKLSAYGFVRIHRGFLANVRFVCKIDPRHLTLINGDTLPISRKNMKNVKANYSSLVGKFIRVLNIR